MRSRQLLPHLRRPDSLGQSMVEFALVDATCADRGCNGVRKRARATLTSGPFDAGSLRAPLVLSGLRKGGGPNGVSPARTMPGRFALAGPEHELTHSAKQHWPGEC
jgi:hypothetical protein